MSSIGLFQIYRSMYRATAWILAHTGPLSAFLPALAYKIHQRLRPVTYMGCLPDPIRSDQFTFYHGGISSASVQALAMETLERDVVAVLTRLIQPGQTILDIGAHIGYFSVLAARHVGSNGIVWAFEAVPHHYDLIKKNAFTNGYADRIKVVCAAVGRTEGTVNVFINTTDRGQSSLYAHTPDQASLPISVSAISLDLWAANQGWPSVDIVKMDIEGAEVDALEGMIELSRHNPHLRLIIEFNPPALERAAKSSNNFINALRACGFQRVSIIGYSHPPLSLDASTATILERYAGKRELNLLCEKETSV